MTAIKAGPRCITAIKDFEKYAPINNVSLVAFHDGYSDWTIGWGRVNHPDGSKVRAGDRISLAQAEAFLMEDVGIAERVVARAIKVPLSQDQIDALVMFAFNCGGRLVGSSIAKAINAGRLDEVPALWMQWRFGTDEKTGKKVESRGLVRRRRAELELWRGLDKPDREEAIALVSGTVTNVRPGAMAQAARQSKTVRQAALSLLAGASLYLDRAVTGVLEAMAAMTELGPIKAGLTEVGANSRAVGLGVLVTSVLLVISRRLAAAREGKQG